MSAKDLATRVQVAQLAAAERWGKETDRTAATAPGRAARRAKLALGADPTGDLIAKADAGDPKAAAELEYRVAHLHRAHMLRMSLKAKANRTAKAKANREAKAKAALEAAPAESATSGADDARDSA